MKIIKIFLASSESLAECRRLFEIDINRLNIEWIKKDMFLELIIWENFKEYMVKEGKQKEYDRSVSSCDIFVMIFSDFVGKYSMEEFDCAVKSFEQSSLDLPKIYTYYIEPPAGSVKDKTSEEFIAKLSEYKHYVSQYKTFEEIRRQFRIELDSLTREQAYFNFPDNSPRIIEKVLYIKMLYLSDKSKNSNPVYQKYIERLQAEEAVYDEAQFFETIIYSGKAKTTRAYNYSASNAAIDMHVMIPMQDTDKEKLLVYEDEMIRNSVNKKINLNSNVFYSVTSFINAFQKGKTFYQTRADEPIDLIRLIVDFSSLPNHNTLHLSSPVAEQYNPDDRSNATALTVSKIKNGVYQAMATALKPEDIVVMRFDINWDEVI